MAEVLVTFAEPVIGSGGEQYVARACGSEMDDGRWQGWIEFVALDGSGTLRSRRETTQPNHTDVTYWATGLTPVYLEGALERTLRPAPVTIEPRPPATPTFDEPAPPDGGDAPAGEAVLNPFSVYRKGEGLLRRQLSALAAWHLVNIITAYELSERSPEDLNLAPPSELIEIIVDGVRETADAEG
ncbi:MAG TPA: hypothetical protein VFJ02_15575 [Vicinamibacterales bacterium]|nr:hypothetical protein [Vicinamibacterales bacterium]